MNRSFCFKCLKRKEGGTGSGRQYRCPKCAAERLAAMLTRPVTKRPAVTPYSEVEERSDELQAQ